MSIFHWSNFQSISNIVSCQMKFTVKTDRKILIVTVCHSALEFALASLEHKGCLAHTLEAGYGPSSSLFWCSRNEDKPSLCFCPSVIGHCLCDSLLESLEVLLMVLLFQSNADLITWIQAVEEKTIYLWWVISFSGYPRLPWEKRS